MSTNDETASRDGPSPPEASGEAFTLSHWTPATVSMPTIAPNLRLARAQRERDRHLVRPVLRPVFPNRAPGRSPAVVRVGARDVRPDDPLGARVPQQDAALGILDREALLEGLDDRSEPGLARPDLGFHRFPLGDVDEGDDGRPSRATVVRRQRNRHHAVPLRLPGKALHAQDVLVRPPLADGDGGGALLDRNLGPVFPEGARTRVSLAPEVQALASHADEALRAPVPKRDAPLGVLHHHALVQRIDDGAEARLARAQLGFRPLAFGHVHVGAHRPDHRAARRAKRKGAGQEPAFASIAHRLPPFLPDHRLPGEDPRVDVLLPRAIAGGDDRVVHGLQERVLGPDAPQRLRRGVPLVDRAPLAVGVAGHGKAVEQLGEAARRELGGHLRRLGLLQGDRELSFPLDELGVLRPDPRLGLPERRHVDAHAAHPGLAFDLQGELEGAPTLDRTVLGGHILLDLQGPQGPPNLRVGLHEAVRRRGGKEVVVRGVEDRRIVASDHPLERAVREPVASPGVLHERAERGVVEERGEPRLRLGVARLLLLRRPEGEGKRPVARLQLGVPPGQLLTLGADRGLGGALVRDVGRDAADPRLALGLDGELDDAPRTGRPVR